jgi:hypothetical protein
MAARAIRQNRQVSSALDGREILRIDLSGRYRARPAGKSYQQRGRAGESIHIFALTHRPTVPAF